jgi:peptidylprolyl isomerase
MTLEKGSLVLVDYTVRVKDNNQVIETTREEEAKKTDSYDPTRKYQPRLVSVGEGWVLKGLDEALANTDVGEHKNAKVRMIPQRKLGEKADEVSVGDVIDVDDRTGIVRFVGSGRIQVDFNHRYAGRTLLYEFDVVKKLETNDEKISALLKRWLPIEEEKLKFTLTGEDLEIQLPEETYQMDGLQAIKSGIARDIFRIVTVVKNIRFVETLHAPKPTPPPPRAPEPKTVEEPKAEEKPAEAK